MNVVSTPWGGLRDILTENRHPLSGHVAGMSPIAFTSLGGAIPKIFSDFKVETGMVANFPIWGPVETDSEGHRLQRTAPEIIINAVDRIRAQRVANLFSASYSLLHGELFPYDEVIARPLDSENLEDLTEYEYASVNGNHLVAEGLVDSARCAARVTNRRVWAYSLFKYWTSLKTCSVPVMELHPRDGMQFGIESDPASHVVFAQSIVAAYSAIEELGLEIRASKNEPSMINQQWNPVVLRKLEGRLMDSRIKFSETIPWSLRNAPTQIERARGIPPGKKASWSKGSVRDREIPLVDAINYASWMRSKVSAHRLSSLTKSLTIHDVHNVQHLARRLLMETPGFWRT